MRNAVLRWICGLCQGEVGPYQRHCGCQSGL
jgi:hypothetical protein